MKIELNDRYARTVLRSLKDREEGLEVHLRYYSGCDIGDSIAQELAEVRAVKEHIESKMLAE